MGYSAPIRLRLAAAAAAAVVLAPALYSAEALQPGEAFGRYLAGQSNQPPACSDSVFAVQIDASLPALKKYGSMSGFKWIIQPGHVVYRGLRFTGDAFVKSQVIARFISRETNPQGRPGDTAVTPVNYIFAFDRVSDYNGRIAYVFVLKPRRKRDGLFRGELWLDAETATRLRLWGDLVKSPSIFVRSLRFVQDYQTVHGCTEPLRLLLSVRTRIAGAVEMTVWLHPASEVPEFTGANQQSPALGAGESLEVRSLPRP